MTETEIASKLIAEFVVFGEPGSKANQRKIVMFGKRAALINSEKSRNYGASFRSQCPQLPEPYLGDVCVEMIIWYASRRPDLEPELIYDLMQTDRKTGTTYIYRNDRQVKRKITDWALDPENPRVEIRVTAYEVPSHRLPPKPEKKPRKRAKTLQG